MANTKQAKKRAQLAEERRERNMALRSKFRTFLKKVIKAIEGGDKPHAQEAYKEAVSVFDRMVGKKIIHKNKAARHKSRLSARIKNMGKESGASAV